MSPSGRSRGIDFAQSRGDGGQSAAAQLSVDGEGEFGRGGGAQVISGDATYLVELGWSREDAMGWLSDTARLAAHPPGELTKHWATNAPGGPVDAASADPVASMRARAYGELEVLERRSRADLLLQIAGRSARKAASLGAAGLALLSPEQAQAGEGLRARMAHEGSRGKSRRLLDALRCLPMETSTEPLPSSPASVACRLAGLGALLRPTDLASVVVAEVHLAFVGFESARAELVRAGLDGVDFLPRAANDHEDPGADAVTEDRAARLLVLVDFLDGRPAEALRRLNAIPLLLDRSASAGTMRAVAESRCAGAGGSAEILRDEFVQPIDGDERRRIARFLALAHGVPR